MRLSLAVFAILLSGSASAQEWPLHFAEYSVEVVKAAGLEPEDPHWMHLHVGHHTAADAAQVTLRVNIFRGSRSSAETLAPAESGIDIRYTVHGVAVSDWLPPSSGFEFTLRIDNP